jgi:hypothetical protein
MEITVFLQSVMIRAWVLIGDRTVSVFSGFVNRSFMSDIEL